MRVAIAVSACLLAAGAYFVVGGTKDTEVSQSGAVPSAEQDGERTTTSPAHSPGKPNARGGQRPVLRRPDRPARLLPAGAREGERQAATNLRTMFIESFEKFEREADISPETKQAILEIIRDTQLQFQLIEQESNSIVLSEAPVRAAESPLKLLPEIEQEANDRVRELLDLKQGVIWNSSGPNLLALLSVEVVE